MNNLIATIEEIDPGHFNRRMGALEELAKTVKELGFFPLPITRNDSECFSIRLESVKPGKYFRFSRDMVDFFKVDPKFLEIMKETCRYEK